MFSLIAFACIALITGCLQFMDNIHLKNSKMHRYIGKIYIISIFISRLKITSSEFTHFENKNTPNKKRYEFGKMPNSYRQIVILLLN
ncbi:DUF2306 domain-containing protein [Ectobacillus funiculus]|uniref:DUF2306 domain-containing protein n=1 Tax=Ectobacillus funiculus TaxID=137993 RepID=UPI00397E09BE